MLFWNIVILPVFVCVFCCKAYLDYVYVLLLGNFIV